MKKIYFFFLFAFVFLMDQQGIAQYSPCGSTQEHLESVDLVGFQKFKKKYLQSSSQKSDSALDYAPIVFHVFHSSDSSLGATDSIIQRDLQAANEAFLVTGIQFYQCDSTIHYYDDGLFNSASVRNMNAQYRKDYVINIFYKGGVFYAGAYYGSSDHEKQFIVMNSYVERSDKTLIHELGHFYGLPHTHATTGGNKELVNGSNCDVAGDLFCDTPADPILLGKVNQNCEYTSIQFDENGDQYDPLTDNHMSYSRQTCREQFTLEQIARMVYTHQQKRPYLTCLPFADLSLGLDSIQILDSSVTAVFKIVNHGGIDASGFLFDVKMRTYVNGFSTLRKDVIQEVIHDTLGAQDTLFKQIQIDLCALDGFVQGNYYLDVFVDSDDQIVELDEDNNSLALSNVVVIDSCNKVTDLAVDTISIELIDSLLPSYKVRYTLRNLGAFKSSAFDVGLYFSANNAISDAFDYSAYALRVDSIDALGVFQDSVILNFCDMPALKGGAYYIGYVVDVEKEIFESNEFNNNSDFGFVQVPFCNKAPDLYADSLWFTRQENVLQTQGRIINKGSASSSAQKIQFYLQKTTNSFFRRLLYELRVDSILPADTLIVNQDLYLCDASLNLDLEDHFLSFQIDVDDDVLEYDETTSKHRYVVQDTTIDYYLDSCSALPNLRLSQLNVSFKDDTTLNVYPRISNQTNAGASSFVLRVFSSDDQQLDSLDYLVSEIYVDTLYRFNQMARSYFYNICSFDFVDHANQYIITSIDDDQQVLEFREDDNVRVFEDQLNYSKFKCAYDLSVQTQLDTIDTLNYKLNISSLLDGKISADSVQLKLHFYSEDSIFTSVSVDSVYLFDSTVVQHVSIDTIVQIEFDSTLNLTDTIELYDTLVVDSLVFFTDTLLQFDTSYFGYDSVFVYDFLAVSDVLVDYDLPLDLCQLKRDLDQMNTLHVDIRVCSDRDSLLDVNLENNQAHYLFNLDSCTSIVDSSMKSLVLSHQLLKKQIKIYPNPVSDMLYIDYPNEELHWFKLFDLSSRLVLQGASSQRKVDLGNLPKGAYFIQIYNAKTFVEKTLIKH